jgi:hypothetical protein
MNRRGRGVFRRGFGPLLAHRQEDDDGIQESD